MHYLVSIDWTQIWTWVPNKFVCLGANLRIYKPFPIKFQFSFANVFLNGGRIVSSAEKEIFTTSSQILLQQYWLDNKCEIAGVHQPPSTGQVLTPQLGACNYTNWWLICWWYCRRKKWCCDTLYQCNMEWMWKVFLVFFQSFFCCHTLSIFRQERQPFHHLHPSQGRIRTSNFELSIICTALHSC